MPSTSACCCPAPRRHSWRSTSAGSFTGAPGGIVAGVSSSSRRCSSSSASPRSTPPSEASRAVSAVLGGLKPVVVAIVVEALWRIGGRTLRRPALFAIAAGAFLGIFVLRFPFPGSCSGRAFSGLAGSRFRPASFSAPRSPATSGRAAPDAVLSDAAPPAPHTLPSRRRTRAVLLTGALLWAVPLAALALWRSAGDGLHAREYRFFTQAAWSPSAVPTRSSPTSARRRSRPSSG